MKNYQESYLIFSRSPIFSGVEQEKAIAIIKENSEIVDIKKGETITLKGRLSCLTKGKAGVKVHNSDKTVVKELTKGEVFGCAVLFGGEAVSDITALCDCELITIQEEKMCRLFETEPKISLNYIRLLSEKIRFLNMRLGDFTSGNANERVLSFLKKSATSGGEVKTSMTLLANQLGIGRTSIYRTLSELEEQGLIQKNKNIIKIL